MTWPSILLRGREPSELTASGEVGAGPLASYAGEGFLQLQERSDSEGAQKLAQRLLTLPLRSPPTHDLDIRVDRSEVTVQIDGKSVVLDCVSVDEFTRAEGRSSQGVISVFAHRRSVAGLDLVRVDRPVTASTSPPEPGITELALARAAERSRARREVLRGRLFGLSTTLPFDGLLRAGHHHDATVGYGVDRERSSGVLVTTSIPPRTPLFDLPRRLSMVVVFEPPYVLSFTVRKRSIVACSRTVLADEVSGGGSSLVWTSVGDRGLAIELLGQSLDDLVVVDLPVDHDRPVWETQ